MKRHILDSSFATEHRRRLTPTLPETFRRLMQPQSRRASTPAPLGTLWDPTLLDRLQAPLSRIRE